MAERDYARKRARSIEAVALWRVCVRASDWLDALAAAWRAERLRGSREGRDGAQSDASLTERVALGIALAHLRIVDEHAAPGDRVRVRVAVPEQIDLDNLRLAPGDPVRLWAEHPDEPSAVRGVFERREEQSLWLMLDRAVDEVDRDYALDPEAPEVTFDRGDARDRARKGRARDHRPRAAARCRGARASRASRSRRVTWTPLDDELDDKQRAAVEPRCAAATSR